MPARERSQTTHQAVISASHGHASSGHPPVASITLLTSCDHYIRLTIGCSRRFIENGLHVLHVPATEAEKLIALQGMTIFSGQVFHEMRPAVVLERRFWNVARHQTNVATEAPKSTVKLSPSLSVTAEPLSHQPMSGSSGLVGVVSK